MELPPEDKAMPMSRLRAFVAAMTHLVEVCGNAEADVAIQARGLLTALVAHDDWLPAAFARPDPDRYTQYLLWGDPLERFSLVSFVWGPGQRTPVHDHTVWGLIGMLRGAEISTPYTHVPNAVPAFVAGAATWLRPGMVEAVSPAIGDIHAVENALEDEPSISIHLYGGNIGTIRRHVFDPVTGAATEFVSGYTAPMTPNLWPP
jgi:predicted metal-dependent enzyme (double-stranded beta helix superfamily)